MSLVSRPHPRAAFILALLATTAASTLLGACSISDHRLFSSKSPNLAATQAALTGADTPEAAAATAQWAAAYAKNPQDPRTALNYARALKAIGSKDQAMELLKLTYQANQTNGEVAAELGRLALDMGRLDIAKVTLQTAEAQGVRDWKTLSAQGTLHAKQGDHTSAQHYYLAALQLQPDAASVINNLALSYALDGKADKAETLLRKTVDGGRGDKRMRQNLALVLGLEGKFNEARQLASIDMPEADAKASMAYLRNMLTTPGKVASLDGDEVDAEPANGPDDWQPYAQATPAPPAAAHRPKAQAQTAAPAAAEEPSAVPARVATLLPSEGGSSAFAKSPAESRPQAARPAAAAPATLLRATVN